jgi:creatinine amidohydrolase
MLHLDPARVRVDRLEVGNTEPLHTLLPTMQESGVRAISANGVLGDATKASAELGLRLFKDAVDGASATYDALLASLY